MNRSAILSPFWELSLKDNKTINFHPTLSDSTHFIVSRVLDEGTETIGHVYVEFYGDEFRYISTNRKGREIFQPTTDFNLVEMQFERYARFLALQKVRENNKISKILNHNINLKNTSKMKTQLQNTAQKTQKQNQLRFIEYEKPAGDGHFITVGDSYHNVIARVHKSYNPETKKYEYIVFDHAGNLISKNDKLWEVKNELIKNREQHLEQAHQRRIGSKEKSKELLNEKTQKAEYADKTGERKSEMEKLREGKSGKEKQNEKALPDTNVKSKSIEKTNNEPRDENNYNINEELNQQEERAQELDDLRNGRDEDRGDMDLYR